MDKKSPDLVLEGRLTNLRKLPTRGTYDGSAFDLEIGGLQTWLCAAFGGAAGLARKFGEGEIVRIHGHATSIRADNLWQTGIKVGLISRPGAADLHQGPAQVVAVEENPGGGRRGWLEILDVEKVSWCLESANQNLLEDLARRLRPGAMVDVSWRNTVILHRMGKDRFEPIMSSELLAA